MTHFLKLCDDIDVGPINAELAAHPELWGQNNYRKIATGTPHSEMTDIWVRTCPSEHFALPDHQFRPFIPVWYPAAKALPSVVALARDLAWAWGGDAIYNVLITKIPPGSGIASHYDEGWHVDFTEKFYVPVQSEPDALFICEDEPDEAVNLKPGTCTVFDNRKRHRVENNSPADRVTLICCIRTQLFGRA